MHATSRLLMVLALALLIPGGAQSQTTEAAERPCTSGVSGGVIRLSPRAALAYAVTFRGDSAHIGAVFVGRAEDRLHGSPELPPKPVLADAPQSMSGGTIGGWYMQYDRQSHTAWVHTQKVPLGSENVVLVDHVDRLHEPPVVVGTIRIPSAVYTGGCREGVQWWDRLMTHLERMPQIQAFLDS